MTSNSSCFGSGFGFAIAFGLYCTGDGEDSTGDDTITFGFSFIYFIYLSSSAILGSYFDKLFT